MYHWTIATSLLLLGCIAVSAVLPSDYNVFSEVDKYLNHVIEKPNPRLDAEAAMSWTFIQPEYLQDDIFDPHMLQWWINQLYLMNIGLKCNQTNVDFILHKLFNDTKTKGKVNTKGRLYKAIDYHVELHKKRCSTKTFDLSVLDSLIRGREDLKFGLFNSKQSKQDFNFFNELDKYLNEEIKSKDAETNMKAAIVWLNKQKDSYARLFATKLIDLYSLRNDKKCDYPENEATGDTSNELLRDIYKIIYVDNYGSINWDGPLIKTVLTYFRLHLDKCSSIYKSSLNDAYTRANQQIKDYILEVANTPKVCDFYTQDLRKDDKLWPYECLRRYEWIDESILATPIFNVLKKSKRAKEDYPYLFNGDAKYKKRSEVEEAIYSLISTELLMRASNYYVQTYFLLRATKFEQAVGGLIPGEFNDAYRLALGLNKATEELYLAQDDRGPLKKIVSFVADIIVAI